MLTRFDYTRIIMEELNDLDPSGIRNPDHPDEYRPEAAVMSAEVEYSGALTSGVVRECIARHLGDDLTDAQAELVADRVNARINELAGASQ